MNKYEAMVIIKSDLSEDDKKAILSQTGEVINKNGGHVLTTNIWAEKKKLYFSIKKHAEGTYVLVTFEADPQAIVKIRHAYNLNEFILRVLITRL